LRQTGQTPEILGRIHDDVQDEGPCGRSRGCPDVGGACLITKTDTNPFFVKMKEGAEAKAAELGMTLKSYAGASTATTKARSRPSRPASPMAPRAS
jgi:hypothetical protein